MFFVLANERLQFLCLSAARLPTRQADNLWVTRVLTVPVRCGTLYVDNRPHVLL